MTEDAIMKTDTSSDKRRNVMTKRWKHMTGAIVLSGVLFAAAAYALPTKSDTDFTDNGDGTVTDKTTGLMWQQQDDGVSRANWDGQLQYCAGLNLGGHADWRLPNIKELASLVDPARENPATFPVFHGVKGAYSSSTRKSTGSCNHWCLKASNGEVASTSVPTTTCLCRTLYGGATWTYDSLYTRCVRGGR
jgi:hypothetical protein